MLICQSLFSWVNDGSHSIHDDLYINHGEQTNGVYLRVFREIFYNAGQIGHYLMMKGEGLEARNVNRLKVGIGMILFGRLISIGSLQAFIYVDLD